MDASKEAVEVLTSLLPGFLFLKVVAIRSSVSKYEAHRYIVDALIASLVVYSVVAFLDWASTHVAGFQIMASIELRILVTLVFTVGMALLWSVVINQDWLAKWLHRGDTRISTHAAIFPVKGIDKFKDKWHLIRFSDGKEIVGIVREYNHETHEALIENGRLVMTGGKLSPDQAWYYSPSGEQIVYMRTLEEGKQ